MLPKLRDYLITLYHERDAWKNGSSPNRKQTQSTLRHHEKIKMYIDYYNGLTSKTRNIPDFSKISTTKKLLSKILEIMTNENEL